MNIPNDQLSFTVHHAYSKNSVLFSHSPYGLVIASADLRVSTLDDLIPAFNNRLQELTDEANEYFRQNPEQAK